MPRKSETPDLFESGADKETPPPRLQSDVTPDRKRILLPSDLDGTLEHLDDDQIDALLRAVTVEARRRGRSPLSQESDPTAEFENQRRSRPGKPTSSRAQPAHAASVAVPRGQANLIRAAFKSGMKPAAISRELGISQLVVRQVLTSE